MSEVARAAVAAAALSKEVAVMLVNDCRCGAQRGGGGANGGGVDDALRRTPEFLRGWHAYTTSRRCCANCPVLKCALVALSIMRGLAVATRGLTLLKLVAVTLPGLVMPSLRLFALTRVLAMPSFRLVAPTNTPLPGLVTPWVLVAPCTRVAHGHRLRARLVLACLRVVLACLDLVPARRPRPTAAHVRLLS